MADGSTNGYILANSAACIKTLRRSARLSQQQFADLLDVFVALLKQWESGQTLPPLFYWQRLVLAETEGLQALQKQGAISPHTAETRSSYTLDGAEEDPFFADFLVSPKVVRTIVEGERLAYGHLFNPAFATKISLIDPLPHQRIAVYDHMLKQTRLRFLRADDAGTGKTIMVGLYIREMLSRHFISRVLIVPPAGLAGNWEHKMHTLFHLPFCIVTGGDSKNGNSFTTVRSDLLIVGIDTLGRIIELTIVRDNKHLWGDF